MRGFEAGRAVTWMVPLLIVAAIATAYANSLYNGFQLDDWHVLEQNPWIRDLGNIPRFFVDPSTFSVYRPNIDYRPVLQTTYALNYAISGYDVWSWHLLQLLLHAGVIIFIFFLGRILFGCNRINGIAWLSEREGDLVAATAAILYAVHPITTGCANYFSARSSLLVAFWALPALLLYLKTLQYGVTWQRLSTSLLLFALALFTKVEAISLLAMLVLAEYLLAPAMQLLDWRSRLRQIEPWRRLWPFVLIAVLYLLLWMGMQPDYAAATRQAAEMTPYHYLLTQLKAWWYYIGELIAPVNLIADTLSYPVSTSILDPHLLFAASGWLIVFALMAIGINRAPAALFLACGFFVYLAPHSSIVPLAEMVNEHRPYLPLAHVAMLFALGGYLAVRAVAPLRAVPLFIAAAALLTISFGALTIERNRVWQNDATFWADVVRKAPDSSRAQMNYGLSFLRKGVYAEAERYFRAAVRLAPAYAFARINLAIALEKQGDPDAAAQEYNRAVSLQDQDGIDGTAHYWRGIFLLRRGKPEEAVADLKIAVQRIGQPVAALSALAESYGTLGDAAHAWASVQRAVAIDEHIQAQLITRVGSAFWQHQHFRQGGAFYRLAVKQLSNQAWVWSSLANFSVAAGDSAGATEAYQRVLMIAPDDPDAKEGLARLQRLSGSGSAAD